MGKWETKNGRLVFTCDNLGEYFNEFAKYRNSPGGEEVFKMRSDFYEKGQFWEDKINNKMVDFLIYEYGKDHRSIELPVDLKSSEWLSQKEKISQTLKEIWKTGGFKNPYNLDLNWPRPNRQPDQSPSEKKELEQALSTSKYQKSPPKAEEILAAHIGFQKEKEWFKDQVYLYSATQGNFTPTGEIICYVGPPGTGKTTFIYRLSEATGRPCQTIACAGQSEFNQFSILGTKNKPSLAAWAIKQSGCRNPLILLDELEKASNPQIQKDLIKLFDLYQQKEKLFDPYFQTEIDLAQITFFATVNYADELAPLLKNKLLVRKLENFTPEEKRLILTAKSRQIEKEWGAAEEEIIPPALISELARFPEEGVRQSEAALHQVLKQWILWKADSANQGKKFSLGSPSEWLAQNVLISSPRFQIKPQHYFLFVLWGVIVIFALTLLLKNWILKSPN